MSVPPKSLHQVVHHAPSAPVELRDFFAKNDAGVIQGDYKVSVAKIVIPKAQDTHMETIHVFSRKLAEGNCACSFFLDLSDLQHAPSKAAIMKQLEFDKTMEGKDTQVRKVAVIAGNKAVKAMIDVYFGLASPKVESKVYTNRDEAWKWLWTRN